MVVCLLESICFAYQAIGLFACKDRVIAWSIIVIIAIVDPSCTSSKMMWRCDISDWKGFLETNLVNI